MVGFPAMVIMFSADSITNMGPQFFLALVRYCMALIPSAKVLSSPALFIEEPFFSFTFIITNSTLFPC